MRIALVCDWLTTVGGAEVVLKALHEMYPEAPIYTSQYDRKGIDWFDDADVKTGWLQHFPKGMRRFLSPLRQVYFSHLDLSEYDLVISVTGAEAKAVKTVGKGGKARHVCYCHVPTQYYWQFYDQYLREPGFGVLDPLARLGLKLLVKPLRKADYRAAQRPDEFVTISSYAAEQIKKYYNREAKVVPPPVDVEKFHKPVEKNNRKSRKSQGEGITNQKIKLSKSQVAGAGKTVENSTMKRGLVNYSRQVTWKRLDLIVKACIEAGKPVTLIGDGPEHENLVKLAGGSDLVSFLPAMPQEELLAYLYGAEAFIFPSLEPFGIAPVEALAAGTPVVAFAEGGSKDFMVDDENGVVFKKQTVQSLARALAGFDRKQFSTAKVSASAQKFSVENFKKKMKGIVQWKQSGA